MNKKKMIFMGILCAFMPGIGFLIALGYYFAYRLIEHNEGKLALADEVADMSHRQVDSLERIERLVAVSEALALNDTKIKKEVLIGVLREDKMKYIEPLKVALHSHDMEASHYAAVALMDIKDEFQDQLEEIGGKIKESPDDLIALEEYARALEKSIVSGLNDIKRQRQLNQIYGAVLEKLIHAGRQDCNYYEAKIKCEMQLGNLESAYAYCLAFKNVHEENEKPYICLMQYYYVTRNADGFKKVLEELKASTVALSRTGIQTMRFWLGGMA